MGMEGREAVALGACEEGVLAIQASKISIALSSRPGYPLTGSSC
jgi:hypothetical protein